MWLKIFKAGTHRDMAGKTFECPQERLEKIARVYNEQPESERRIAPHVAGHPSEAKLNDRAFGWVEQLRVNGEYLEAKSRDWSEKFVGLVKDGAFKTRSIALNKNDLLTHVGHLGAAQPAIAGLGEISFADGEEGNRVMFAGDTEDLSVFSMDVSDTDFHNLGDWAQWKFRQVGEILRGIRDVMIDAVGLEKANEAMSAWPIDSLVATEKPETVKEVEEKYGNQIFAEGKDMKDEKGKEGKFAEPTDGAPAPAAAPSGGTATADIKTVEQFQAALDATNAKLEGVIADNKILREKVGSLEAENAEMKEEAADASFGARLDALVLSGHILPAEKDGHMDTIRSLRTVGERTFADGTTGNAAERYVAGLAAREPHKLFGEHATRRTVSAVAGEKPLDYGRGTDVVDEEEQRHFAIKKLAKEKGISYESAFAEIVAEMEVR